MLPRNQIGVNSVKARSVIDNFNLDRRMTERQSVRKLESLGKGSALEILLGFGRQELGGRS
jgi:hypothetical protein